LWTRHDAAGKMPSFLQIVEGRCWISVKSFPEISRKNNKAIHSFPHTAPILKAEMRNTNSAEGLAGI